MRSIAVVAFFLISQQVAQAENESSRKLLVLSDNLRNGAWTTLLQRSGEKCDQAIRSVYQGSTMGQDEWNVACRNGIDFSISLYDGPEGKTKILTCKELQAIDAMLMTRAGGKPSNKSLCWRTK
jgi:hypothetical protein